MRLISAEGEQLGVVPIEDALRLAEEAQLDLVEVAPEAQPPVCRIYDYKKAMYEQKRRQRLSRKKTHVTELKEIKLRITIDKHDLETKLNHARKFMEEGDKVKFTIMVRGREITKPEMVERLVASVVDLLKDIGEVEQPPQRMGKQTNFILGRRKDWTPKKAGTASPAKPGTAGAPSPTKAEAALAKAKAAVASAAPSIDPDRLPTKS